MSAAKLSSPSGAPVKTDIPARLDRLPWSRFHLLIVVGLGVTWILDGLEVTIVGALGPALQNSLTLHLSSANLGAVASFYVVGAVTGALVSGWVTDRFGRRLGVLCDADRLSRRRPVERAGLELLELCAVPDADRNMPPSIRRSTN
jgi:hypothetical protein